MNHPGPWKYIPENRVFGAPSEYRNHDEIVDAAGGSIMGNTDYYPWVDLNEEEWRMVAAAPQMLKTIQFIASIFEGEKIDGHDDCRCLVCEAIPTECARVLESIFGKTKKTSEVPVAS